MIIVKLIGGLGNQLFQYAAARRIAHIHGAKLKIDKFDFSHYKDHNYGLWHFNIIEDFANQNEIEKIRISKKRNKFFNLFSNHFLRKYEIELIRERHFHFDPEILLAPDNTYLDGYWQSEKYFIDIDHIIRKEFTIKSVPDKTNEEILSDIQSCNSISVHVRRGDYVTNSSANSFHGTCSLEYYQNACEQMARLIPNPVFFIFSDDPDWTKTHLKTQYSTIFVTHNSAEKGHEDLRLMSACKNHIIANSTFSWWGAWLGQNEGKIVCAPKKWFAGSTNDTKDLIPKSWITL